MLELRRLGEAEAEKKRPLIPEELERLSAGEIRAAFHELQVHQIELEMQNDELHRIHAELEITKARYFDFYNLAPVGYISLDELALIIEVNSTLESWLNVKKISLIKQPIIKFIHHEDQGIFYLLYKNLFATKKPQSSELRMINNDGISFWVEFKSTLKLRDDGVLVSRSVLVDISERKHSEQRLRKNEEQYRLFFESAGDMMIIISENGDIVEANQRATEKYGYTHAELLSMKIIQLNSPEHRCYVPERLAGLLQEGFTRFETVHLRKDGSDLPVEVNARRITWEGRPAALSICRDISRRKLAENQLKITSNRLDLILQSVEEGILGLDLAGRHTFVNTAAARMLGYGGEELLSRPSHTIWHHTRVNGSPLPEGVCPICVANQNGKVYRGDNELFWRKDGSSFPVHYLVTPMLEKGAAVGAVLTFSDVSAQVKADEEKAELEEQLRQAQKMESIGTLAGGIAHDFNNLLAVILGYADLALTAPPFESNWLNYLRQITSAGHKAKDLVAQILAFSRQLKPKPVPLQPVPLVKEAIKFLRSTIPATIAIHQEIDPGCDAILADPTQFYQVLMNLCANAYQSMESGASGDLLEILLANDTLGQEDLAGESGPRPGRYVRLTVQDNGPGIPLSIRERIFDPYFTTKELGKGTGLGLAVVHGIVKNHGGVIRLFSSPGEKTTFQVYFPSIELPAPAVAELEAMPPGGREHLLVVDDERAIAEMVTLMLEDLGYTVTKRSNGIEALETFMANPDGFDLLITDMAMPGMNGVELAKRVRSVRPELPTILSTGHSNLVEEQTAKELGLKGFVLKPYSKPEIAKLIRAVLDDRQVQVSSAGKEL